MHCPKPQQSRTSLNYLHVLLAFVGERCGSREVQFYSIPQTRIPRPLPIVKQIYIYTPRDGAYKQETGVLLLTKCGVVSAQANQLGDSLASQTGVIVQ